MPEAPYFGLEHVETQTMRILGQGRGSDVKSTKTKFSAGDVLYGKLRPYLNKVAQPDTDGMCSTDFLVFTESPALDPGYLANYLNQLWVAARAHRLSNGVELPRVDWKSLSEIPISFPRDKVEQRAIVGQIVSARRSQARALERVAAARHALKRFRQSVLASASSGRLTTDWRISHRCDRVSPGPPLSVQASTNSSGSPNTDQLSEVPETWSWWAIESAMDAVIDYRGRTPPHQSVGPIPHVRTTQIRDGRIDWATDRFVTHEVYDKYMTRGIPRRGDILFTMEAPMGEVGIVDRDEPFSIAQRILLLRLGRHLVGEFLAIALQSHAVHRAIEYRSTGTGVSGIAYKRFRSVLLPVPPIDEQREIVRRTSVLLELTDRLVERAEAARRTINRTSQSVLARAFRGELVLHPPGKDR